jgi:hypothetical protein
VRRHPLIRSASLVCLLGNSRADSSIEERAAQDGRTLAAPPTRLRSIDSDPLLATEDIGPDSLLSVESLLSVDSDVLLAADGMALNSQEPDEGGVVADSQMK